MGNRDFQIFSRFNGKWQNSRHVSFDAGVDSQESLFPSDADNKKNFSKNKFQGSQIFVTQLDKLLHDADADAAR